MVHRDTVLVVDDDPDVCRVLGLLLERAGFSARIAADNATAKRVFDTHPIDLVVLDIRLPDGDGMEFLKAFRRHSDVPVIMLTGVSEPADRVIGLELGADDYVCKPFVEREVLARVRSLLRRARGHNGAGRPGGAAGRFIFDGWEIDIGSMSLKDPEGQQVELTTGEFRLMECLVRSACRPLTRDQILDAT